jgi:hypothetical protein
VQYLPIGLMEAVLSVNWKGDQISGMFATIMLEHFLFTDCVIRKDDNQAKHATRRGM